MQKLPYSTATVTWRNGQPYASQFDDVYFSTDNGLLETDYVFLQGNDLLSRWQKLRRQQAQLQQFTIIETGFGTGLNFLCAVKLWLETAPSDATLHFISTEKYPLSVQDITSALTLWPTLAPYSTALLAQYAKLMHDQNHLIHTLSLFENRAQLTLFIGDATVGLKQITTKADAWFLDGFAPAKNPDMWQAPLFSRMAQLSTSTTTLATFTSAGEVRRGLTQAGFRMTKRAGFGKKREMLTGTFVNSLSHTPINRTLST